jgi:multidrug efflux pump subunit AcrA (membrane-fusion protein)
MTYAGIFIICLLLKPSSLVAENRLLVTRATNEFILTGYTRNIQSQIVSSEIAGKVLTVNYDIGDPIEKKPFITMDPTFIDFQITRTSESLEQLAVTIKKASSKVSYFENESLRIEKLHKEDLATEAIKDKIFQDLEQAQLELDSALKESAVVRTQLSELKERRMRHQIYAPPGWIVTDRTVEENENVQAGTQLARVSDYRNLVVPLYVSSNELTAVTSLPVTFDADLEGEPVKASINWINPEFDEKTRKLNIEIIIKNYAGIKRGGLKLTLPVKAKAEGLYIPKAAVSMRYENPTVTLKHRREVIQLLVLEDAGPYLLVSEDDLLIPGTELEPAGETK